MERTKSGILGFDDIIGGGFPRGICCLIAGTTGSGRITFGIQFLYNGIIDYGENGVYVSLKERPRDLRMAMPNFGWDLDKAEKMRKLAIIDMCPARENIRASETYSIRRIGNKINISAIFALINEVCREVKAQRIVIDDLPSLQSKMENEAEMREATSLLNNLFIETERTSILTTEIAENHLYSRYGFEEYITRGLIVMRAFSQYGELVRRIQVIKMGSTRHCMKTHPMEITSNGIRVGSQVR
jgi:KaiC/GvpD/RAD55 family RecA-like ATPase